MKMQKILWAYDGSEESDEALDYVKFLAKKFDSKVKGVYVNASHITSMFFYPEQGTILQDMVEKTENEFRSKLSSRADSLFSEGIDFEGEILKGEPSEEIIKKAAADNVDLIVMGKRGHGLADENKTLIGSTTLKVLRKSDIPVLAVKKKDSGNSVDIKNILVPVDIFEKSSNAFNYAIDWATVTGANISILYVFWMLGYFYGMTQNLLDYFLAESYERLETIVQELKEKREKDSSDISTLEIDVEVLHGTNPGITIIDYASKKDIDLIVINPRGRIGTEEIYFGSVTEKVIRNSTCSVLVPKS